MHEQVNLVREVMQEVRRGILKTTITQSFSKKRRWVDDRRGTSISSSLKRVEIA